MATGVVAGEYRYKVRSRYPRGGCGPIKFRSRDPGQKRSAGRMNDVETARCMLCPALSAPRPRDLGGKIGTRAMSWLPTDLPPPVLCADHWTALRNDWLLLGWCVDHYGRALSTCPVHDREIEPL